MNEEMQSVIIKLSDGRIGAFTGMVLVRPVDEAAGIHIVDVKFTDPLPLPKGYRFTKEDEPRPLDGFREKLA